ncbi:MAG: MSMEG_4193 family putative phosphomutase [Chloroflexi bacterium]|nr:MSMEG_4193 family putative phosphomutase [Chloroflexota bacterium]MCC6894246.1 MSMEG_4193 family putative phosphomutase [Anaerolineae bacterium]
MTQILLIRHAVNDFVKTGKLAGWTPGVHLNEEGQAQAAALGKRLADTPIDHLYASPLERTMETAEAIRQHHPNLTIQQTTELGEVRYGDWEGMEISKLLGRKMWQVVQQYPSRAEFPNGETMRGVQTRAVNAVEALVTKHPRETIAIVSHADIIKMVLAHFLGMHLDEFQRIVVSPASISMLSLGFGRPYVGTMNDMAHVLQMEQERKQAKAAEKSA